MTTKGRRGKGQLKKELGLFDVYAVAAGATLSSGFFLLPGLAAATSGAAFPLGYALAALLLVPGLLSQIELATAMPRAGGVYYFVDRSMGPLLGTIAGFGTWISLTLKAAFALIGMGAYVGIFFPDAPLASMAAAFAFVFGSLNIFGAKRTSSLQVFLLVGLLILLGWFTGLGLFRVEAGHFTDFLASGSGGLLETTGLVIVSYTGLTKVASVSEEVRDPERNLPLGILLAFASVVLIYVAGTTVMVGVVGVDVLARDGGDLTPVATVAEALVGRPGAIVMTVAAVLAFASVANAGILSASRYPMAMSRDNMLPAALGRIGRRGTPHNAIYLTVALIVALVLALDPTKVAKLAGAFQLTLFTLMCLAVVVMRESRIESYDPGFRAPFYPWLQIAGVVLPFWMIIQMGWMPTLFAGGLVVFGAIWYTRYARGRVTREGAIYHVFERLGRQRDEGLDSELRGILKEKGLREADPFEELVAEALVLEAPAGASFEDVVHDAAHHLAAVLEKNETELANGFLKGTAVGMTPVSHGAALPHVRLPELVKPALALVRSGSGLHVDLEGDASPRRESDVVHAVFFLVSPQEDAGRHLRILAQIAGRVDDEGFLEEWLGARDPQELKEVLLRDERLFALHVSRDTATARLVGRALRDLKMPEGTLVALIRRESEFVVPRGNTVLEEGDRLTIIGDPAGISSFRTRFNTHPERGS